VARDPTPHPPKFIVRSLHTSSLLGARLHLKLQIGKLSTGNGITEGSAEKEPRTRWSQDGTSSVVYLPLELSISVNMEHPSSGQLHEKCREALFLVLTLLPFAEKQIDEASDQT
jgi:hypothetical protein